MRRIEGDGITLAVHDEGEGPAVLFLHGFPGAPASRGSAASRPSASTGSSCSPWATRTRNASRRSRSGAARGTCWYRANAPPERELRPRRPFPAVAPSTLGVWSSGDEYLTERQMLASAEHVTGGWRYERVDDASHWMQLDARERINELLLEFLR